MSSHAAAAISAMITSQVYPQMWRPAPRPARRSQNRSRQPKDRAIFSKGNTKAVGSIQVLIGVGVLATVFFTYLLWHGIPAVFITISLVLSIMCIISGVVSAFARGNKLIIAAVVTSSLSAIMALVSIVIDSLFVFCGLCNGILLFLSILNLFITVLSIVYGCKVLCHAGTQEPVTGRQEGWRDGLSRREDEKMLNTFILGPQAKNPATHQP
ncbi:uncharacterized protein [Paramormyrops kingsleyae]|uniref:uncharacterized protein n=1 Tax=Paramormyrops kingsleyae TaxID=1676925 RepID=UPI003B97109C